MADVDVLWHYNGNTAIPAKFREQYIPANPVSVDWLVRLVATRIIGSWYFVAPLPDDLPVDILHMDWFS